MEDEIVLYLDIDDEDMYSGMSAMSFVDKPATQINWNTFSESKTFKFKDEDKRIITAPAMFAETPIKKYNDEIGYYYVKFSAETIERMAKKYFKENKIHNMNEQHDSKNVVKDVYLFESYIISDKIKSELYPDLPNGSWVVSYFVDNEDYWNSVIKTDKFKGISLEGNFYENYEFKLIEEREKEIENILDSDLSDKEKKNKIKDIVYK